MKLFSLILISLVVLNACSGQSDSEAVQQQSGTSAAGQYMLAGNTNAVSGQYQGPTQYPNQQGQNPNHQGLNTQPGGQQAQPAYNPAQYKLPDNALRVQRVEIIDRQGFERPLVAATAMIPVGWQTQGGVVWSQSLCGPGYSFNWSATAPDGNRGIAVFPSESWTWSNFQTGSSNCATAQISSVKQYLETMISRARPGARIIDYRARDDLTQPLQHLNSVMPMSGGEFRTWVEAGEILVGYTNQNGVEIRETAATVAFFSLNRMQGLYGEMMETLSGQTLNGFAAYAPNGKLNFQASETMRKAIQPGGEWQSRINKSEREMAQNTAKTYRNISKINADGARQRSEIIARTGQEISAIQMETWNSSNDLWDKQTRETGEWINEVETYNDPNSTTGEVQLSYDYKNAWRLNDGTYVLTDDPYFNAYETTGQNGVQLEVQQ